MKRRECSERHGCICESVGVGIAVEEGIYAGETAGRAFHRVICRHDAVKELIP